MAVRSPRRRLFLRLALCLGFGALATLATAWGPPMSNDLWLTPLPGHGHIAQKDGIGWWVGHDRNRWYERWGYIRPEAGEGETVALDLESAAFSEKIPSWAVRPDAGVPRAAAYTTATGWPWRCARSYQRDEPWGDWSDHERWVVTIRGDPCDLPIGPLWAGLIANLAVWGAIPALPLFAWPALRRWRRRRKGLCVACGYPRDAARPGPCPECGE